MGYISLDVLEQWLRNRGTTTLLFKIKEKNKTATSSNIK